MAKYVVYMKNSYTLLNKEFFSLKDGMIVGSHSPLVADHFDTRAEAEELKSLIKFDQIKIGKLEKEIEKFEKTNYVYRTFKPIDKSLFEYNSATMSNIDVLNWRINNCVLYKQECEVPYKIYTSYPQLYSIFKTLWEVEVYNEKKTYKPSWLSFKIAIRKNVEFEEFKNELDLVIDKVNYLTEDGYKKLSIMDHELSQYDSYYFHYKGDDDCKVSGSYSDHFTGSLEECFKYVKKNHYYE